MVLRGRAWRWREGVLFSEGRTLCARIGRPNACRGTSWRTRGPGVSKMAVVTSRHDNDRKHFFPSSKGRLLSSPSK